MLNLGNSSNANLYRFDITIRRRNGYTKQVKSVNVYTLKRISDQAEQYGDEIIKVMQIRPSRRDVTHLYYANLNNNGFDSDGPVY